MSVKLLTKYHLEFLSLKGGCRGSSESTHVKMSNCWKSHSMAQMIIGIYSGLFRGHSEANVKKLVIFQGGPDPLSPPLDPHLLNMSFILRV